MPAAYIHERIAKKALAQISPLSTSIKDNLDAFELGSQGPDILFFYNIINFLNRNTRPNHLGERMHKERISALFKEILINTKNQKGIAIAWSLGFVSHYAVDCTIHPYVYAMSNNDDGTTNTTKHLVLESQFDTWCYQRRHAHGVPRQVRCISKLSENQIS
ncbi:MAG: zinc dependent phospholipase C family protein, partial [Clostridiales bacterium]|nr:zinc dependent phospholipase C family protein [Clostridiales bacterium]